MKIQYARWVVLAAVFAMVTIGLVLNTNLGTLSSFGWDAIAYICPLGVLESLLASKSIFLRALIVLAVVIVFVVMLGKVFCAWVCPVAPLRSLRGMILRKLGKRDERREDKPKSEGDLPIVAESAVSPSVVAESAASPSVVARSEATWQSPLHASGEAPVQDTQLSDAELSDLSNALTSPCSTGCSSCATKRTKLDSRHIILGGSLLTAAIFGFPVFCLICPIGLIFGTVIIAWQFIGGSALSFSLILFPIMLILELVVFRKWCSRFCPMGALFSLLALPNRFLKPVVNQDKCLRAAGGDCHACASICPEHLDPHYADGMQECTKCGLCKDKCPAQAVNFALLSLRKNETLSLNKPVE